MSNLSSNYRGISLGLKILASIGPVLLIIARLAGGRILSSFEGGYGPPSISEEILRTGYLICVITILLVPIISLVLALLDKAHKNDYAAIGGIAAIANIAVIVVLTVV